LTIADFTVSYTVFKIYFILGFFVICFVHIAMYTDGVTELTCSMSCGS